MENFLSSQKQEVSKLKGQAETPFVLTMMVIIVFGIWFTSQIAPRYPQFQFLSSFDAIFFAGAFLTVAGACAIATGLACAGALAFFSFTGFFFVQNTLVFLMVFTPIVVTIAYVISRLARAGG